MKKNSNKIRNKFYTNLSEDYSDLFLSRLDFEVAEDGDDSSGGGNSWREELQRRYQQEHDFLAELRARNVYASRTPSANSCSDFDRGEREEAEGEKDDDSAEAQWVEAVHRWVHR